MFEWLKKRNLSDAIYLLIYLISLGLYCIPSLNQQITSIYMFQFLYFIAIIRELIWILSHLSSKEVIILSIFRTITLYFWYLLTISTLSFAESFSNLNGQIVLFLPANDEGFWWLSIFFAVFGCIFFVISNYYYEKNIKVLAFEHSGFTSWKKYSL